jgi:hypothetical protein
VNESGAGSGEQSAAGNALDERVARALALPDAQEAGGAGAAGRSDATDAARGRARRTAMAGRASLPFWLCSSASPQPRSAPGTICIPTSPRPT